MQRGVKVYFVLYVIMIIELLVVISERDAAEDKLRFQIGSLDRLNIDLHKKPLELIIPQDTTVYAVPNIWTEKRFTSVILIPENLVSKAEEDSVKFYVKLEKGSYTPPYWPIGGLTSGTKKGKFKEAKYSLIKKGKYCQFIMNIDLNDILYNTIDNEKVAQNLALDADKLEYKFIAYIKTPRIISKAFNVEAIDSILNGLSFEKQMKFLHSLPNDSQLNEIAFYLDKDPANLTFKDTLKFKELAKLKYEYISKMKIVKKIKSEKQKKNKIKEIWQLLQTNSFVDSSRVTNFVIKLRQ